jgi:hypothetical protein
VEPPLVDEPHHHAALAGHEGQQGLGLQRQAAVLKDVPEGAAVVEADQLAVVLVLRDLDVVRL